MAAIGRAGLPYLSEVLPVFVLIKIKSYVVAPELCSVIARVGSADIHNDIPYHRAFCDRGVVPVRIWHSFVDAPARSCPCLNIMRLL